jgi:hypothetical protein
MPTVKANRKEIGFAAQLIEPPAFMPYRTNRTIALTVTNLGRPRGPRI